MKRKLTIIVLIFFIAGILTVAVFFITNSIFANKPLNAETLARDEVREMSGEKLSNNENNSQNITNIALFGLDSRDENEPGRADSIILLTLDYENKTIKISSFMRDLKVHIDGHGYTKLGHAFAYGGGNLAVKTLNDNYGLSVEKYIAADFSSFEKIVDLIGGLEVDINMREKNEINKKVKEPVLESAGTQLLNGRQIVAYSRIRKVGNADFERTERQRKVLEELMIKISALPLSKIYDLAVEIEPLLKTNLEPEKTLDLILGYHDLKGQFELRSKRFPIDGTFKPDMSTGIFYLLPTDENKMQETVYNFIYAK